MSATDFDPDRFINCEAEHRLFAGLLSFADRARVLAVRGASGTGKSQLLRSFAHQCRTARPQRVPVCLLSLDQPGDAVLPIVQELERQLSAFDLRFPSFKHYESARADRDFGPFRSYLSFVDLKGASFDGAKGVTISGTTINPEYVEQITIRRERVEFSSEQVVLAQDVIVKAFFDDLAKHCAERPVVLLLDGYEKSRPQVRAWVSDFLLERLCFDLDGRPGRLVVVIAGQEQPHFHQLWGRELCAAVVRPVHGLSPWERRHIEAAVQLHELPLDDAAIDAFHHTVRTMGLTPAVIMNMIQTSLASSGRRV